MSANESLLYVQSCLTGGGPFLTLSVGLFGVMVVLLGGWFLSLTVREGARREQLKNIRDLLIEGSLGQAILQADRRAARDPVFATVRAAIAAIQSTKDPERSMIRATEEADQEFGSGFIRKAAVLVLLVGTLLPAAAGIAGQQWAHVQIGKAAEAMHAALEGTAAQSEDVLQVWSDGRASLQYECPARMGVPASALLLLPVTLLGLWGRRYWGQASRSRAVAVAEAFVHMSARVLDPKFRVYQQEQGIYQRKSNPWDEILPRG